jgi:hypothetical protein
MAPYAARIEALERTSMPPPIARTRQEQQSTQQDTTAPQPPPSQPDDKEEFTLVTRKGKNGKKRSGTIPAGQSATQPTQPTITPISFANAAASTPHIQQPKAKVTRTNPLPTITEVTVLRTGGHIDPLKEDYIRSRAADAIAREVRLKMTKLLVKPILLRAGRWSVHPRSKGNFVYSFDGYVPFDVITSYEHILLEPFQGTGKLCPSLGWT